MAYTIRSEDIFNAILTVGRNYYPLWHTINSNNIDEEDWVQYVKEFYKCVLEDLRGDYGNEVVEDVTDYDIEYVWLKYQDLLCDKIINFIFN